MAEKFYHTYYDKGNTLNRVEIHDGNFGGAATEIENGDGQPVNVNHEGDIDNFDKQVICGRELVFRFFYLPTDGSDYDSLFTSDYKDIVIKWFVGGVQKFEGYLKPEQTERSYVLDKYVITLVATDGLAHLKESHWLNAGALVTGYVTPLEAIKYCIAEIGIEKDILVQLGTYEANGMTSTQCALSEMYFQGRRFMAKNGLPMKAYEVLTEVLKDYNCKIWQDGSYYVIRNFHEGNSYDFEFDYATLTQQSRTASDNIVDIAGYAFTIDAWFKKITPINKTELIFKNKSIGSDVTGMDLSDWNNGSIWTINASNGYSVSSGVLTINSNDAEADYIETASFSVTKVTDNDYLKILFDVILDSYTAGSGVLVGTFLIRIEITNPNETRYFYTFLTENWNSYESPVGIPVKVTETGDYSIRISFIQPSGADQWTTASIKVKDVAINKVFSNDEGDIESYGNVLYDEIYVQSSGQGYVLHEEEFLLGDGIEVTSISSFFYDSGGGIYAASSEWNSYGGSEGIPLMDIYSRNILNNRYSYKNHLYLTIFDEDNTIEFGNIIEHESKYYTFLTFNRQSRHGFVSGQLVELVTTSQSYNPIFHGYLSSSDGEAIGSGLVANPVAPAVPDHNDLFGIYGSEEGYHLSQTAFTNVSNLDSMAYESTDDYYNSSDLDGGQLDNRYYTETEINTWRNSVTQTEMGYLHGVTSDIQDQINSLDAYGSWDFKIADETADSISSGDEVRIIEGGNITITRTSGSGWYGATIAVSTGSSSNWNTAYTHSQVTTGNPHSISVNDLTDVTISSIGNNEILQYYSTGSYFRNRTFAEAGISAVGHEHSWNDITSDVPTTLSGYGISGTMANFDTACSNGNFIFDSDFTSNGIMRRTGSGTYSIVSSSASISSIQTTITDFDTALPTSGAVVDYVAANSVNLSLGADNQIPVMDGTTDFAYSQYFKYDPTAREMYVSNNLRIGYLGTRNWKFDVNSSGLLDLTGTINSGGDGYNIEFSGGDSSSTTSTHNAGNFTLKGGDQTGTGGGDGGHIFIYGGSSVSGDRGSIYFGDGSNMYVPEKEKADNTGIFINTTTGKLSYGTIGFKNSLHGSGITTGDIFDALDPYVGDTAGDTILITGGVRLSGILYAWSKAERIDSDTIRVYWCSSSAAGTTNCNEGDTNTYDYGSIAW